MMRRRLALVPLVVARLPMAVVVEVGLRVLPLPRLAKLVGAELALDEPTATPGPVDLSASERRRVSAAYALYARLREPGRCLRRSFVVAHTLRDRDPVLRIGTAAGHRQHAWVEIGGAALDAGAHTFTPLRRAKHRG